MQPIANALRFDSGLVAAVRANNQSIVELGQDEPVAGGNLVTLKQQIGDGREPIGVEYSFFGYKGSNAEELVAILLLRDFEKNSAVQDQGNAVEPDCNSALLDPKYGSIGISNKAHPKCTNSIQIVLLQSVVNQMM